MDGAVIGGALLSSFLNVLFERIASKQVIDFFVHQKLNEGYLKKLRATLRSVNKLLGDAEERQITDADVKEWLDDLKNAVYEADDLLDEIAYEARRAELNADSQVASSEKVRMILASLNLSNGESAFVARIEEVLETFKDLLDQKSDLGLTEGAEHRPTLQLERRTTSLVVESRVYGRDADKEAIIGELVSDKGEKGDTYGLEVLTIVGMGGVGKTTLAQLAYGDHRVEAWFQLQAWVCVGEEFDVFKVTRDILKELDPENEKVDRLTENQLHNELKKKLKGHRFLIVLDDIWDENQRRWDLLMAPLRFGGQGSRILVTTRGETVASIASTAQPYPLKVLSDDHCWSIFAQRAFQSENCGGYLDLAEIGRKIVAKCKGLPLAANALGCLLSKEREAKAWQRILDNNIWGRKNDDILPALRLSYNYLPSNLKRCFGYCSIIPKDYQFMKDKLILLWMAEGLVDSHHQEMEMEEIGKECFDGLVAMSFFQQVGDGSPCFVMHDLINDLAKSVSGEFCCRAEGNKLTSVAASKRIRHLSYGRKIYTDCEEFSCIREAQNLRTLLPNDFFEQPIKIRGINREAIKGLLSHKKLRVLNLSQYMDVVGFPESIGRMKHLRLLDLSETGIRRLPDFITRAFHLQTLNLEGCIDLVELPDSIVTLKYLHYLNLGQTGINKLPATMGHLCQLQTLILSYCSELVELPDDITSLISLCHLDLRGTKLQHMPPNFGNLIKLQTLTYFCVGDRIGSSIRELQKLHNLQGDLSIGNIQNVVNANDAMEADLTDKKHLERLKLIWKGDTDDSLHEKFILERLQPHTGLQCLSVVGYGGTRFPNWVGDPSFTKMVTLILVGCKHCYELPPLGQLEFLRELRIARFDAVVSVGPSFYGHRGSTTKSPFQSLQILEFEGMCQWKIWENTEDAFPGLEELYIENCPELTVSLPSFLPCLTKLQIRRCAQLTDPFPRVPAVHHFLLWDNYCNLSLHWRVDESRQVLRIGRAESLDAVLRGIVKMGVLNSETHLEYSDVESLPLHMHPLLPSLMHLKLKNCPELGSFPEVSLLPKLESLFIKGCHKLVANYMQWNLQQLPSLSHLGIDGFYKWLKPYEGDVQCFPEETLLPSTLSYLKIKGLKNLVYLQCRGLRHLSSLKRLQISQCPQLQRLPFEDGLLPGLTSLQIEHLDNLTSLDGIHHLSSLQELAIVRCHRLQSLPKEGLPRTLTFLKVYHMKCLNSITDSLKHHASLQRLSVGQCPMLKLVPEDGLPSTITSLTIKGFRDLKSLNYKGLQHLSRLQQLTIYYCPELWSVTEDALPASLIRLEIQSLRNVVSIDYKGFKHLQNLTTLWIKYCSKLQSLPEEGLPSSLSELTIFSCPELEKKCGWEGDYWPNISHISSLEVGLRRLK